MEFKLTSEYVPTGDQPEAISQLVQGLRQGEEAQTLLGVTGSGKTFTMANVIQQVKRPTLILSHNKTLAAQLYSEMRSFFPENAVQYFISYYDYYQPEAYIPSSDKYIEKDLMINDQIEKMRLATTAALLSGRRDVVVVSSVSCIFGMGNPEDFAQSVVNVKTGQQLNRNSFLRQLVDSLYSRCDGDLLPGRFRVRGDTVDIMLSFEEIQLRVVFWGDEVEKIQTVDPHTGVVLTQVEGFNIYPANIFVASKERTASAIDQIALDLGEQSRRFRDEGKELEANRLCERVNYDLEMIKELGHCSGIENYSRYFDGRSPGMRPFCLLDYFPKDFLMIIDESHVTLPQIRGMYSGDLSRKTALVDYGFRIPSAYDNRPLKFDEFKERVNQLICVSATPGEYELSRASQVAEQVIRPTGLLDPEIEVRKVEGQVDDLLGEIKKTAAKGERVLVTTLTKRMAEMLTEYLDGMGIRVRYMHSEIETIERMEIIRDLRLGEFDVLVGINLLREGLDLPEVGLVAILDADKEGFLRSATSLIQTIGRAARNADGRVIMYADTITPSMKEAIDETARRRQKQQAYNKEHNITPRTITKAVHDIIEISGRPKEAQGDREARAEILREQMRAAAAELDFETAARLRDRLFDLTGEDKPRKIAPGMPGSTKKARGRTRK